LHKLCEQIQSISLNTTPLGWGSIVEPGTLYAVSLIFMNIGTHSP